MGERNVFPPEVADTISDIDDALGSEPTFGLLARSDFDFINAEPLTANGEATINLRAPGGDRINGQAKSSGQYTLKVRWLDETFSLVREEGIIANRPGGEWSNFALDSKSPFVDIVIEEDSGVDQTADATGHYL